MAVKERILLIRLTEKLDEYPLYARKLGIEAIGLLNQRIVIKT